MFRYGTYQSEGGGPRTDYCTSWAREWTGGLAPVDAFFVVAVAATRVYQSEGGGTRQELCYVVPGVYSKACCTSSNGLEPCRTLL